MKRSVLLVDDFAAWAEDASSALEKAGDFVVTIAERGTDAASLAQRQLFDFVVVDAKLDYRGVQFGGIRLADDLKPRYGIESIVVISQFHAMEFMKQQNSVFPFHAKPKAGESTLRWAKDLAKKLAIMKESQYAFVAMPFNREMDKFYAESIKMSVIAGGLNCLRADELPYNKGLAERIIELVSNCKLLISVADGANPNAYYETGIADAQDKQVVLVVKNIDHLRSDLRHRFAVLYEDTPSGHVDFQSRITNHIEQLRMDGPIGIG